MSVLQTPAAAPAAAGAATEAPLGKGGKRAPKRPSVSRTEARLSYLFIAPALIGFACFTFLPMMFSLGMSFMDYGIITPPKWVGLDNWATMLFRDPLVWQSLGVTLYFALGSVAVILVLAFGIAILMNQRIVGQRIFRTIYYMPSVISGVPVALLWSWLFHPSIGVFNSILGALGIQGPYWLTTPEWVIPSLIIMSTWSVGGAMVIYLAGLQGVPQDLYEAAELDGAGPFRKTWNITIPMVSPIIFFNLILSIIGAMQAFTQAYIMTDGGPINSSLFSVLYIYRNAFAYFKMGYASALAWLLFIVIGLITVIIFRTSKFWVYEENDR